MNRVWSELERQFIRENAGHITDEEGAKQLSQMVGRKITIHAWRKQRQALGIKKEPGRGVCQIKPKEPVIILDLTEGEGEIDGTDQSAGYDGNPSV